MIQINYRDSRPIYEQIEDSLKKMIVSGILKADEKLPSVRTLATELSINPNTIQRAYNELEAAKYIYSVAGKGSFVDGNIQADDGRRNELMSKLSETVNELKFLGLGMDEVINAVKEVWHND